MKKNKVLTLILAIVVIAALGAAYYFVSQMPDDSDEPQTPAETSVEVLSLAGIDEITYTSAAGDVLTFVRVDDKNWQWAGDPDFPVRQVRPQNMAKALEPVTAISIISEDPEDLSVYGLDKPQNMIIATNTEMNQSISYAIGATNTHSGDGYMQVVGDKAVYYVSGDFIKTFSYGLDDIVKAEFWPIIQNTQINAISITNERDSFHIDIEALDVEGSAAVDREFHVTTASGETFDADKLAGNQLMSIMPMLILQKNFDYSVKGEELAAYGLDDPKIAISVDFVQVGETQESSVTMYCGGVDEETGLTYFRFEGSNAVNGVDTTALQNFAILHSDNLRP